MTTLDTQRFELYLPPSQAGGGLDQDEEWCEIELDGERRRIRLHDYAAIFNVPGLYEQLFCREARVRLPGDRLPAARRRARSPPTSTPRR